ncbi:hypothetical protein [Streptomyces sp. NPDC001507]|uniref:hypothetical protein n=1 Tax=Streptomyces sp. NPDC001507 TaxID=3364579 RepID=UPI0036C56BDD
MNESSTGPDFRAQYEASSHALALGASRAYLRALAEHQDAALGGDPVARRAIAEAGSLLALAAPGLAEQQHTDPAARQEFSRRSIA